MSTNIKNHFDDDDILKISFNKDLERWQREFSFLEKELDALQQLLQSSKLLDPNHNKEDANYLQQTLVNIKQVNAGYLTKTINFSNQTMGIRECEDVHCEAFFYNEHFEFQQKINSYFDAVHALKQGVYDFLLAHKRR